MAMSIKFFFLLFLMSCLTLQLQLTEGRQQKVPAIFVFGDSLVDVGNNNHINQSFARADFRHNGLDFAGRRATGRFSNGKNAADFIAEKLGLPTSPPYLSLKPNSNTTKVILEQGGMSFASGGGGILNLTKIAFGPLLSIDDQLKYYSRVHGALLQDLGAEASRKFLAKSLFTVVIGSNDLFVYFGPNSEIRPHITPEEYINTLVATLKNQLKKIYGFGGRKFAVVGTPLIGCTPQQRIQNRTGNRECNEESNFWSLKLHEGVKSTLQTLKSTELKDINYSMLFTYGAMLDIVQNPAPYGLSNVRSACCGLGRLKAEVPCLPFVTYCRNRNNHLFWDLVHPTEVAARIFVDLFYDSAQYTSPISLRQLAAM